MIFLKDNVLLESELQFDHIKPRLLGMSTPCEIYKPRQHTDPSQATGGRARESSSYSRI